MSIGCYIQREFNIRNHQKTEDKLCSIQSVNLKTRMTSVENKLASIIDHLFGKNFLKKNKKSPTHLLNALISLGLLLILHPCVIEEFSPSLFCLIKRLMSLFALTS